LRAASGKLARIDNLAGCDGDLRESIRYTVTKMLYDATGRLGDRLYMPPSTAELKQITKEWTA